MMDSSQVILLGNKLDLCHLRDVGVIMTVSSCCRFVIFKVGSSDGFLLSSNDIELVMLSLLFFGKNMGDIFL